MPSGIVRDLDMPYQIQVFPERSGKLSLLALRMVNVILYAHIRHVHFFDELRHLLGPVQKESGNIIVVNRLHHQQHVRPL
jgi:hypothetical protein